MTVDAKFGRSSENAVWTMEVFGAACFSTDVQWCFPVIVELFGAGVVLVAEVAMTDGIGKRRSLAEPFSLCSGVC